MPFLLLWQGAGTGGVVEEVACLLGDIEVLVYPMARATNGSPVSQIALSYGVPLALVPIGVYPIADIATYTYLTATIRLTTPTATLPGTMTIITYPQAVIAPATSVPVATIECKEHV